MKMKKITPELYISCIPFPVLPFLHDNINDHFKGLVFTVVLYQFQIVLVTTISPFTYSLGQPLIGVL